VLSVSIIAKHEVKRKKAVLFHMQIALNADILEDFNNAL